MRFSLVAISVLFSLIFFLFYTASLWKNIFLIPNNNFFFWDSVFWSLLYSPIIYFLLAIFYFIYFRHQNKENNFDHEENSEEEKQSKKNISNTLTITVFLLVFIFLILTYFKIDYLVIYIYYFGGILVYFICKELLLKKIISQQLFIIWNIYSIISAYFASVGWIIYYIVIEQSILMLSTLIIVWFYHIYIHVTYQNIISFIFWTITFIFALYRWIIQFSPWII